MLQCNMSFEENLNEEKFDALLNRLRDEAAAGTPSFSVAEKMASYAVKDGA